MRDFFKSELETLYAKTQLKQYENLSAMEDGKRQIGVMIDSCVLACSRFPEIPDDKKKEIILTAMEQDGDFKGFSSPWVWKVLNAKKDVFYRGQTHFQETGDTELPPEKKPVSDERRAFWLAEWQKTLEGFVNKATGQEINSIKDPMIQELRNQIGVKIEPRPKFLIGDTCPVCKGATTSDFPDQTWCEECEGTGEINRVQIQADNEAEARKVYNATFH